MTHAVSATLEHVLVTNREPTQELLSIEHGGHALLHVEASAHVATTHLGPGPARSRAAARAHGLSLAASRVEDGLDLLHLRRPQGELPGHGLEALREEGLHMRRIGWSAMASAGTVAVAGAGRHHVDSAVRGVLSRGEGGDAQGEHQAEGGQGFHRSSP